MAVGKSVGIELGANEIGGCKVGCPEGDTDIEGVRLLYKVGLADKLSCSLRRDVGRILSVGLKLGSNDR